MFALATQPKLALLPNRRIAESTNVANSRHFPPPPGPFLHSLLSSHYYGSGMAYAPRVSRLAPLSPENHPLPRDSHLGRNSEATPKKPEGPLLPQTRYDLARTAPRLWG
ncbi:hypothetical protein KM043_010538 [Ampulex compressa]|nr:hypothetical protein KM043_010538 [Ampulex compressa]